MSEEKTQSKKKRIFRGEVVRTKMDKTAVVKVDRIRVHPKYGKRITVSKLFKVHDPANSAKVGEQVTFVETRPLSKDKRWRLV